MPDPAPSPSPASTPSAGKGAGSRAWLGRVAGDVFGLDTRSLAVARIGLGLLCVIDVVVRFTDLSFFLTDVGAIPRVAVIDELARSEHISLYMASGSPLWVSALLTVQALAALAFAVGFRTRLANLVLWVLVVSLHVRGGILLQSGDVVMRLLLFWSLFLPMGARLSLDHLRSRPTRPAPVQVLGLASAGFMVQLAVVYIFTAYLKSGRVWSTGEAVYYSLKIDHFAKQPFADLLLGQAWLLEILTPATWFWEILGPYLLLMPFLRGPVRTFVVSAFVFMHLGFFFGLEIGLFPWICIAGWLALTPGWLWDRVGWRVSDPGLRLLGAPALPSPRGWRRGAPVLAHNLVAGFFLALIINWNLSTVGGSAYAVPALPRALGHTLRLDQKWNMFAPYPLKDDGWYAMPGQLSDGRWVDVWRGGEPQWATEAERATWPDATRPTPGGQPDGSTQWLSRDKPAVVSSMYANQRWRKYMRNLWLKQYKDMRVYYGKALCRQHNATTRGGDRLRTFEIWYMKEVTGPPSEGERPVEPVRIWTHYCYKTDVPKRSESSP